VRNFKALGELLRRPVAERGVRAGLVVVSSRFLGKNSGPEDVSIEQLVANPAIERFDMGILNRLARLDEMIGYVAICSPLEHGSTREFGPVVKPNGRGQTTDRVKVLEDAQHVGACQRSSSAQALDTRAYSRRQCSLSERSGCCLSDRA
jgi:hypothetical protein